MIHLIDSHIRRCRHLAFALLSYFIFRSASTVDAGLWCDGSIVVSSVTTHHYVFPTHLPFLIFELCQAFTFRSFCLGSPKLRTGRSFDRDSRAIHIAICDSCVIHVLLGKIPHLPLILKGMV
jgi:hypothetical protein